MRRENTHHYTRNDKKTAKHTNSSTHQDIHALVAIASPGCFQSVSVCRDVPHDHLTVVTAAGDDVVVRGAEREAEDVFWRL